MPGTDPEPAVLRDLRIAPSSGAIRATRGPAPGPDELGDSPQQLRILIVDDQEDNITLLERLLDRAGYSDVHSTTDPTLAAEMCARDQPDLLLLDLHMPQMDGFQIMSSLQPLLRKHRLPILVLSGDLSFDARRRALTLGARDFLAKPLDPAEVLLRVHNLLETHQLQLQLERRNELLSRHLTERTLLMEKFREANLQLETANRAKNRFLANMSHELRTPLNAITGYTGILLSGMPGRLTDKQTQQLSTVQASAEHLLSLINDLLDLAKIEAGNTELKIERIDCRELLDEVAAWLAPSAEEKQLALSVAVAGDLRINSDRRALKQVILNLANNAIKFTQRGEVRIEASRSEDDGGAPITRFSVTDTGCGIETADQGRLFEPFEQIASAGANPYEGSGLGLHICQTLARLIGATVEFESEFGRGSVFTLEVRS